MLVNIPEDATHYLATDAIRLAGGQYRVLYTFFKLEEGIWKQYVSDIYNDRPSWVAAEKLVGLGKFDHNNLLPLRTESAISSAKDLEHRLWLAEQAFKRLQEVHLFAMEMWRREIEDGN